MTTKETGAVMDVLRVAYPQFYRGIDSRDTALAIRLWQQCFQDDPVKSVLAALKRFILLDKKGFPPSPGMIKDQLWQLTQSQDLDSAQAWAMVAKAVNTSDYEKAFAALPEQVRQVVGCPTQLAQWGRMEESTFQSVVASNFQKSYREKQQHRKTEAITAPLLAGFSPQALEEGSPV